MIGYVTSETSDLVRAAKFYDATGDRAGREFAFLFNVIVVGTVHLPPSQSVRGRSTRSRTRAL
jgi:hypothetical protein